MEEENKNNDKYSKPSFDGRSQYYPILKQLIEMMNNDSDNLNFGAWIGRIDNYFSLTKAYIKPDDISKVETKIEEVRLLYQSYICLPSYRLKSRYILFNTERMFRELQTLLLGATKHLLLPLQDETATDFNEDEFMAGSDL